MIATDPTLREDVLVSVYLCAPAVPEDIAAQVERLAGALDARFRFREILLLAKSADAEALASLVRRVDNLRLLVLRDEIAPYSARVVAASEAIGDVVLVLGSAPPDPLALVGMIETAADGGQIVVASQSVVRGTDRILSLAMDGLGRLSGFHSGLQHGATVALPRTLLNGLLDHSDPDLALRFVPRDPALPVRTFALPGADAGQRDDGAFRRRLGLLEKIIEHMAPRVLLLVTIASASLAVLGFLYALYAVGVWIVLPVIQPGWLTTSAMLSLTAMFLGVSIFGLSIGLQRILALLRRTSPQGVATEVNRIDIFGKVAHELNVDLDRAEP